MKPNNTNPIPIHQTFRSANRIGRRRAMGIETLQLMKTRLTMLKLLIILCSTFATTAVFGQTTYTWTNSAAGDIATAANWDPNGQPSGATIDVAQWDGRTTGPLTVWDDGQRQCK
jgi:hypothetical protein